MAPGEGFPQKCGTGWLIPKAFGTLPAAKQKFNILPAFLCLNLLLPFHCLSACVILLTIYTDPGFLIAFGML